MLLDVSDLNVRFKDKEEEYTIIKNISFNVNKGEVLAIVGESGSGKSITGFSIMRLLRGNANTSGSILFESKDILSLNEIEMESIRGNEISMVYQEPMTALNPLLTIGRQICEVLQIHKNYSKSEAIEKSIELLELVKMPSPRETMAKYSHELSGGQRQRVVIAMAIACNPKLIIADEPTTALDVTVQREILELFLDIKNRFGTSIIFITHDLGVVAEVANRVMVLYGGKVLETADGKSFFENTKHPYSVGLIKSRPIFSNKNRLYSIEGMAINSRDKISGCNFYPRCNKRFSRCSGDIPMIDLSDNHKVRCLLYE